MNFTFEKKYFFYTIPFICFFLGYLICNLFIGNTTYITPNLTGLSVYEAVKETSPYQVGIRIISEKENQNIPAGTIINQKPLPGRSIKTHQSIYVVTTRKAPDVTAPDLRTLSTQHIEKKCEELGLKYKIYPIDFSAPVQSCIAQLPNKGDIVHDKKMIFYTAQEKPNMYLMPNLINYNVQEVIAALQHNIKKLTIYQGKQKLHPPYKDNLRIIQQKPIAGSIISLDNPLHIQLEVIST